MSDQPISQINSLTYIAYKSLVNNLFDAVFLLDAEERVLELNSTAQQMIHSPESEVIHHRFGDLFPEFSPLSENNSNAMSGRVFLSRPGLHCYYDIYSSPLAEYAESLQGYCVILHDVTGLQLTEDELSRRTREITRLNNFYRDTSEADSSLAMFRSMAVWLCEAHNSDGAAIVLWDDNLQTIQAIAAHGVFNIWNNRPTDRILSLVSAALNRDRALIIDDITTTSYLDEESIVRLSAHSLIIFPLRANHVVLGVVVLAFSQFYKFSQHEIIHFEQAIEQVRLAMVQASLLENFETMLNKNTTELKKVNDRLHVEIAESMSVEKNLRQEHNFISKILNSLDALVIVSDRKGWIVLANAACEAFFGYSSEEFTHKRVWDLLFQSQDNMTIKDMLANIQAGLSPFQYANNWQTRDGVQKMLVWSSSMIYDDNHNIQYIVAVGMDITDRKNIEKLLERERMLLRSVIDSIPDLIFYKDVNGVYLGWNAAFDAFRKPKRIENNCTDVELYPPELAKRFMETDQQVSNTGNAVTYENWTMDAAGKPVLMETRKTPYYGPGGEITGVIGVGRDITIHRVAENALRAANLEIEQLIDSLSSILIAISDDLRITRWNKWSQNILGRSSEEAVGLSLPTLKITWEWDFIASGIDRCRREHRPIYLDPLKFHRLDGNEGYLGINISPIFGGEYTLTGFIILGADITEKRIFESRLAQAQKLESIGQLAAGIAHEINTPIQYIGDNTYFLQQSFTKLLTAIQKYEELVAAAQHGEIPVELIEQVQTTVQTAEIDYLTEEVPLAITQTLEGIQHVTEIVRAMKGFSHPGVKKKTPVNINKSLLDTITVARNEWKYVSTVETEFDPDLPEVVCLPGEMNQVFLNTIVNAADAIADVVGDGSKGKGKITVQTRHETDWVDIRISDTGTGIPEEIRSRIFEPFFTTKVVGKGSGQGLAIAYDIIVRKHNGTFTFDTKMGKGTTFIIRLPMISIQEGETNHNGDNLSNIPG